MKMAFNKKICAKILIAISSLITVSAIALASTSAIMLHNASKSAKCKMIVDKKDLDEFEFISINSSADEVNFIPAEKFGLEICGPGEDGSSNWEIKNNTLEINTNYSKDKKVNFGFLNFYVTLNEKSNKEYINIYYPKDKKFSTVSLGTPNANICASNIKAEKLIFITTSGNVDVATDNFNFLVANTIFGNINIKDNSNGGNELTSLLRATSSFGNINVSSNKANSDCLYTAESDSKLIEIDGNKFNEDLKSNLMDNTLDRKNATLTIRAASKKGSVRIDFKK